MQSKIYPQGVPENNSNQLELLVSQLMAETAEELESFLMRVKEESEKVSLKLNIKKSKAMASSPTTSWKIDGIPTRPSWSPAQHAMRPASISETGN